MNSVRIPGKVMLSGEYIVLFGGSAVLVPAPRTLTVSEAATPTPDTVNPVVREALAEPIAEIVEAEKELPDLHVAVDRGEFYATTPAGSAAKLGLGGSAAEAVGVVSLRLIRAGIDPIENPRLVFDVADRAHRRAQGGVGSGADVAACAYRRPIRFRRSNDEVEIEPIARPAHSDIPQLALAWTGVPADTRRLVKPFLEWAATGKHAAIRLGNLDLTAGLLATAWFAAGRRLLNTLLDEFDKALAELMQSAELDWRLPVHDELAAWARAHGGRAKPTGAGGGDLALLVGPLPLAERPELIIPLTPFDID